ncbi:MAG: NUDIX domain-containing protein [Verrucomicrobiales bacterium]|nr:NUDIX domain-containing protein [Verrucomicrobiales bacterium]
MKRPSQLFEFCPRCGHRQLAAPSANLFTCAGCGLRYFFNPTVAAAVFIWRDDGRALFIRRARDPAKGRLAAAGGFIDIGEDAETAARREVREEVGIELSDLRYLSSHTNEYPYAEVEYPVLDLMFTARAVNPEAAAALDDVEGVLWLDPLEVDPEEMAFSSMRDALKLWQAQWRRARTGS